jgi:hypothetical protein
MDNHGIEARQFLSEPCLECGAAAVGSSARADCMGRGRRAGESKSGIVDGDYFSGDIS